MIDFLAQIIAWINIPANAFGKIVLSPVGFLPGWLSNTIISAVAGVGLLIIFKYASNQSTIGRARDSIKANMLALKLFKDSISVTLQAQGRVFKGAGLLMVYAVKPLLVMIVPVCLLLGQMALWYQLRPLQLNEEAIITMTLNSEIDLPLPAVNIEPAQAFEIDIGPVRSIDNREIHWKIKARQNGYHNLVFQIEDQKIEKELAVGDGFMRVSSERPGWKWADILLYPMEKPFPPGSIVQSISIDYPDRISHTSGTDWWIGYFFVVSLIFALIFKPILKVRI